MQSSWMLIPCCVSLMMGGSMKALADEPRSDASRRDIHSAGNPQQVRVKSIDLDLTVDFAAKQLHGTARLGLDWAADAPKGAPLVLDTSDLTIESVSIPGKSDGKTVPYEFGKHDAILGTPLILRIPDRSKEVEIVYRTSPGAKALQWLDAPAHGGSQATFPVQPGAGDPYSLLDSMPGFARRPRDLYGHDPSPRGPGRRDGRRSDRPGRGRDQVFDVHADPVLPDRPRGGRPGVSPPGQADRSLGRALGDRPRRLRVRRHREDGGGRGGALRPVSLGTVRHPRPPAKLPVRRHGEPQAHLRHADGPGRRPLSGRVDRATSSRIRGRAIWSRTPPGATSG